MEQLPERGRIMPVFLELFAGTRSMSKAFERHGWETYSVEWNKKFKDISLYADISTLTAEQVINLCGRKPDVIWASPDCTSYSIAGIGFHRRKIRGEFIAISDYAKFCDNCNIHLLGLIKELNPRLFFIENPVGAMRKMPFMVDFQKAGYARRYTVTYCQYGDFRQKPTDIWTNHTDPHFKPKCKKNASCHEKAPRHSDTGTQGRRNKVDRARIPDELCEYIVKLAEDRQTVYYPKITKFAEVE